MCTYVHITHITYLPCTYYRVREANPDSTLNDSKRKTTQSTRLGKGSLERYEYQLSVAVYFVNIGPPSTAQQAKTERVCNIFCARTSVMWIVETMVVSRAMVFDTKNCLKEGGDLPHRSRSHHANKKLTKNYAGHARTKI